MPARRAVSTARSAMPIAIRASTIWRRRTTASTPIVHVRRSRRRLSRVSRALPSGEGAHLAIEIAKRAGVRLKLARHPARRGVLSRTGRTAHRRRCRAVPRPRARRATRRTPRRRTALVAHDDASGTLRPHDDRSDGVWHAGARLRYGFHTGDRSSDGTTRLRCARRSTTRSPAFRNSLRFHVERAANASRQRFRPNEWSDRLSRCVPRRARQKTPPRPSEERLRARRHDWWDRPMAFTRRSAARLRRRTNWRYGKVAKADQRRKLALPSRNASLRPEKTTRPRSITRHRSEKSSAIRRAAPPATPRAIHPR